MMSILKGLYGVPKLSQTRESYTRNYVIKVDHSERANESDSSEECPPLLMERDLNNLTDLNKMD